MKAAEMTQLTFSSSIDFSQAAQVGLGRPLVTQNCPSDGLYGLLSKLPAIEEYPHVPTLCGFGNAGDDGPYGFLKGQEVEIPFERYRAQTSYFSGRTSGKDLEHETAYQMELTGHYLFRRVQEETCRNLRKQFINSQSCSTIHLQNADVYERRKEISDSITMMLRELRSKADRSGLRSIKWVICVRPTLWLCVSKALADFSIFRPDRVQDWDCEFCGSARNADLVSCLGGCGGAREPASGQYICLYCGRVYFDDKQICWDTISASGCGAIESLMQVDVDDSLWRVVDGDFELLEWMRREQKIIVDGMVYDVVLDSGIYESSGDKGLHQSSVYFVPISMVGDIPLTCVEFINYRDSLVSLTSSDSTEFWTDHGMLLWAPQQDKWDFMMDVLTTQRVVTKTPQLGGILESISYRDDYIYTGGHYA